MSSDDDQSDRSSLAKKKPLSYISFHSETLTRSERRRLRKYIMEHDMGVDEAKDAHKYAETVTLIMMNQWSVKQPHYSKLIDDPDMKETRKWFSIKTTGRDLLGKRILGPEADERDKQLTLRQEQR